MSKRILSLSTITAAPKRPFITAVIVITGLMIYREVFVTSQSVITLQVVSKRVEHLPDTKPVRNGDVNQLNDYDTGDTLYAIQTNKGMFEIHGGQALNQQSAWLLYTRIAPGRIHKCRVVGHDLPWLGMHRKIIGIED